MNEHHNISNYRKTLRTHLATDTVFNTGIDPKGKLINDSYKIYKLLRDIKNHRGYINQIDHCSKYKSLDIVYNILCKICNDFIINNVQR